LAFCLGLAPHAWAKDPKAVNSTDKKPANEKTEKKSEAKDSPTATTPAPKIYHFKSEKKSAFGGGQAMSLMLEDALTGKVETLFVSNNDPNGKEYDPNTAVASAVKELSPGDLIQIETEKQKGRQVVTSVSKPDVKPGEEEKDGFVFVDQQSDDKGGLENVVVTLSKFGREVKVGVPMTKEKYNKGGKGGRGGDGDWKPDPKIDNVIHKMPSGTVVIATIKQQSNKLPLLTSIYEYRKPERGQYVGPKEVEFNSHKAAGFEIKADDGQTITFTLEGQEVSKNGDTLYMPRQDQLAAVKRLKPGQEIEVHYRLDGRSWMLHDIKILTDKDKAAGAAKSGKSEDDKMKDKDDAKKDKKDEEKKDDKK
jgi:hypothetical protein